jgi:hypothetical protein
VYIVRTFRFCNGKRREGLIVVYGLVEGLKGSIQFPVSCFISHV